MDVREHISQAGMIYFRNCGYLGILTTGMFTSIFWGNEMDEGTINQRILSVTLKRFVFIKYCVCGVFSFLFGILVLLGQICIIHTFRPGSLSIIGFLLLWCMADSAVIMCVSYFVKGSTGGVVVTLLLFLWNSVPFFTSSTGSYYMQFVQRAVK